ncbi:MAG TPA: hypothetical protein VH110_00345 [Candidatus Acidoferrum sp.]|jgi:hypothetical protein|nr:hypothetical protein [Candidatus Acidoferrum sp.]
MACGCISRSFSEDGVSGDLLVESVDRLHAEFVGSGVPIAVGPVDQTGTRELYVTTDFRVSIDAWRGRR